MAKRRTKKKALTTSDKSGPPLGPRIEGCDVSCDFSRIVLHKSIEKIEEAGDNLNIHFPETVMKYGGHPIEVAICPSHRLELALRASLDVPSKP